VTLALLEGTALLGAVAGTILLWGRPLLVDWLDVAVVLAQAATVSGCCIVAFYYNDLYDFRIVRSLGGFVSRLLQSFGVAMILLAGFYALFPKARIADGPFVSSILVIIGLLLPLRAAGYGLMRHRAFADRVLIVGSGVLAKKLIEEIDARPDLGCRIVGVADDGLVSGEPPLRYPFLGPLRHLVKIAEEARADRIIVAMSERRGRMPMDQLLEAEARGILVEDGLQTYAYFTKKLAIEALTPSQLVFSGGFRESRPQATVRRLISLGVAAAGLVLTAPLMALIALAIKLDSAGSVLFVHDRVGLRGRHFKLLKFRTMRPPQGTTSQWVHDNEDRITRVGGWLRKFRLDELPQFFNILRGDMNLVGPRPHPVSNSSLFAERIPYYVLRTGVRPGVTGWAQIRYGYANNLDEETEKMRYDLYYLEHVSFWFDVRILLDTVKIVLFGRGSEAPDAYPPDAVAPVDSVPSPAARLGIGPANLSPARKTLREPR
jgi:exopolysaccharide biosynthesis polyprenyl glycosylphosphotransferase